MPVCKACNAIYYKRCDGCHKLYEQDVREGRIPPQYTDAGVPFSFRDWEDIRWAEGRAYWPHGATQEEIDAARKAAADQMIKTSIGCYLRRQKTEAEKRAKTGRAQTDALLRSRYTY